MGISAQGFLAQRARDVLLAYDRAAKIHAAEKKAWDVAIERCEMAKRRFRSATECAAIEAATLELAGMLVRCMEQEISGMVVWEQVTSAYHDIKQLLAETGFEEDSLPLDEIGNCFA